MNWTLTGTAAILLAALSAFAFANEAQWQGPGRDELKKFVEKEGGATDMPKPVSFYGDFDGDGQEDAVVFIYSTIEGAAGNFDLKVALFRGDAGKFRFLSYAKNVFGSEPRNAKFEKGKVLIITTMPKQGDPRCCPTGSKRYTIKVPAKKKKKET